MSFLFAFVIILAIGLAAFMFGRQIAFSQDDGTVKPHSLANYHGWWALLVGFMPAVIFLACWYVGANVYLNKYIHSSLPEDVANGTAAHEDLAANLVKSLANGLRRLDSQTFATLPSSLVEVRPKLAEKGVALAPDTQDYMIWIARDANDISDRMNWIASFVSICFAAVGSVFGLSHISPRARARNNVEKIMLWGLLGASTLAIMTTVGIVLSMLFQTIAFFEKVSLTSFFFGTVWDPRFAAAGSSGADGQFGLIPLLAGTLYIAFIALLVAVPIGLMSAVHTSEYAAPKARVVVKSALELLAGIPTIVYGIFALVKLGPFLRDISAALARGTPFIQAQSILTAGLVMGVMLVPVVSSLSDDIITAVPRSLRDGSFGLGATRSETIKRVILPAALPGIMGAILLTASRAIGETMIVVLAAGVAANLTLNPFEAMTTITVKIVNQLTGDLEFNTPQTLVAFALGITLFTLTLVMNIVALYIVRKYREQYE